MTEQEKKVLISSNSWYHKFDLAGITTPGSCKVAAADSFNNLGIGRLDGLTAVDVGAWDGPYTFELERRGAKVIAVDIQDPDRTGFNTAKDILGSKAEYIRGSVYDLGKLVWDIDLVVFFGVYYHLYNPMLAFSNIHKVLRPGGRMLFEGAVLDGADRVAPYWASNGDKLGMIRQMPMCYFAKNEYCHDSSNWFIPTTLCLRDWIEASGFVVDRIDKGHTRAYGVATKSNIPSKEHAIV